MLAGETGNVASQLRWYDMRVPVGASHNSRPTSRKIIMKSSKKELNAGFSYRVGTLDR